MGPTQVTRQAFSLETTSFTIFNNDLVMLYQSSGTQNSIRNVTTDAVLYTKLATQMPNNVLFASGNNLYVAGFAGSQAVLHNVTTNTTDNIITDLKPSGGKSRVQGTVAANGTIYVVGGTYRPTGAAQPVSFFWDSVTKVANPNYINLAGRPTSEWYPGTLIGAFEQVVVEDGIVHLTFETDATGQYFYWNSVDNKIIDFGDLDEETSMSPKSFVVTYR